MPIEANFVESPLYFRTIIDGAPVEFEYPVYINELGQKYIVIYEEGRDYIYDRAGELHNRQIHVVFATDQEPLPPLPPTNSSPTSKKALHLTKSLLNSTGGVKGLR